MIRNQKGFTLIELMVVVLIIGILVAIAIPVFGSAANNAKDKSCIANIRTIAGAVAQYNAENNSWAPDVTTLVTSGFLKDEPVDPHNPPGVTYEYTITTGTVSVDKVAPDVHDTDDSKGNPYPEY